MRNILFGSIGVVKRLLAGGGAPGSDKNRFFSARGGAQAGNIMPQKTTTEARGRPSSGGFLEERQFPKRLRLRKFLVDFA